MRTHWFSRVTIGRLLRVCAVGVSAAVGASLLAGVAYARQPLEPDPGAPGYTSSDRVVPGQDMPVRPRETDPPRRPPPPVSWPKAGVIDVELQNGAKGRVRVGDSPVWIGPAGSAEPAPEAAGSSGTFRVRMLGRDTARRVGVDGVLFTLSRRGGVVPDRLMVGVDYSGFAYAYGGDYGRRLRLVELPGCVLTTPREAECRVATPIGSARNNAESRMLSGEVVAPSSASTDVMVIAAAAADSSDKGDYKATGLSPSAQWHVSEQTGDFGWSYPMRVPPTPGGLAPTVEVSYSSGSVDGRTSNTNNQPSWLGEGFSLSPGFIERRYKPCADDGAPTDEWGNDPGDQCWAYQNATVTWTVRAAS